MICIANNHVILTLTFDYTIADPQDGLWKKGYSNALWQAMKDCVKSQSAGELMLLPRVYLEDHVFGPLNDLLDSEEVEGKLEWMQEMAKQA